MKSLALLVVLGMVLSGCSQDSTPTPRPRTFFRIETPSAQYDTLTVNSVQLLVNKNAVTEVKNDKVTTTYPSPWNVMVYYTITSVTPDELNEVVTNRMHRIGMNVAAFSPKAQAVPNDLGFEASMITSQSPTPVQFIAVGPDRVVSAASLVVGNLNPDSLKPLSDFLQRDLVKAMQQLQTIEEKNKTK